MKSKLIFFPLQKKTKYILNMEESYIRDFKEKAMLNEGHITVCASQREDVWRGSSFAIVLYDTIYYVEHRVDQVNVLLLFIQGYNCILICTIYV